MNRLIELWRKCPLDNPPYILPEDNTRLQKFPLTIFSSFERYIGSDAIAKKTDTSLHVGLLPVPYVGNIQKAHILILMLNPGLSHGDYFAEYNVMEFREAVIRNLRQENTGHDDSSIFLNPRFAWHPGFGYWQKKLHDIVRALAKRSSITYQEALSRVQEKIACLELFPYHSKNFGAHKLLDELPSVLTMIEFVHDMVFPRVQNGELTVIVTRGAKYWKLPPHEKIIQYEGTETRAAHLTLDSKGGKAIAKQLGL